MNAKYEIVKIQRGFTLVELMVVVAIIGILSSVAIPNFKKYQAKARVTEAKLAMSAGYAALSTFSSEYDTYANCFPVMGYDPSPNKSKRYYRVGISGNYGTNAVARDNGATTCADADFTDGYTDFFPGRASGGNSPFESGDGVVGPSSFSFSANGYISSDLSVPDVWKIDENKNIIHSFVGY